jgi:hypothetical protein
MFVRKLILLCLALALLAPLAAAKTTKAYKTPKPNRHHKMRSHKAKIKKGPKANWGSHTVKTNHS